MTEGPKERSETGAGGDGGAELSEWDKMARSAALDRAAIDGYDLDDKDNPDDIAYQKKLLEMQERQEKEDAQEFDPLSDDEIKKFETNMGINAKGEEYQRMPWNTWDNYARRGKEAKREAFDARMAWNKRIEQAMSENAQGIDESPADYQKRVMGIVYGQIAEEQKNDPSRGLSSVELESLKKSYSRNEGENTNDWAKRISEETGVRFGAAKKAEQPESTASAEEEPAPAQPEQARPAETEEDYSKQYEDWYKRLADMKGKFGRDINYYAAMEQFPRKEGESYQDYAKRLRENDVISKYISDEGRKELVGQFGPKALDNIPSFIESDADYDRRMTLAVLSNVSTELANNPSRQLSDVERAKVMEMFPRGENEDYQKYLARVKEETGIDFDGKRSAEASNEAPDFVRQAMENSEQDDIRSDAESSAEDGELDSEKIARIRELLGGDLLDIMNRFGLSKDELDKLSDQEILDAYSGFDEKLSKFAKEELGYSDDELRRIMENGGDDLKALLAKFAESLDGKSEKKTGDAEDAEAMEAERNRIMESMDIVDLREFIKAEGLTNDDIENMSVEELRDLQERLRKRMIESLDIEDLMDLLKGDNLKIKDIEDADFETLKDLREKYRQKFMDDVDVEQYADKLKEWGIKDIDLEQMTLEELIALKKRLESDKPGSKKEEEVITGEELKEKDPLIAVVVNRERDAKIAARMLAEEMFQKKLVGNGKRGLRRIMRNLVFGQMLKDSTMLKYEREAMQAIEDGDKSVRGVDVEQFWSSEGDGASGKVVERMTLAYTKGVEDSLIHEAIGDQMAVYGVEKDESGNPVVYKYSEGGNKKEAVDANSAEAKSTIVVHDAIEKFARGEMTEHDFDEAMKFEKAKLAGEGLDPSLVSDTLIETAKAAKERFDHEESIENVMEGFRLINADYQSQVRTEVHRSKIDEISGKISGKLGIVQPEVIAAAAGVACFFMRKGTSSVARAAVPVLGGALAAGTFGAFKEHNRVAVDRAEQMRRIARGEEVGNTKYDRDMAETTYKSYAATEMTKTLNDAIENGDTDTVRDALARIEALTEISDSQRIDLITFSGSDSTTIEDERLALDVAIAQAKVELKNKGITNDSKSYVEASQRAYEAIQEDIDAKDEVFKKLQRKRTAAQFAKTTVIGAGAAVAGQEITSAFSPNSYGLFDKFADDHNIRFEPFNIGVNKLDAHKTLLAGLFGIEQTQTEVITEVVNAAAATDAHLTPQQKAALEKEGYTVLEKKHTTYTTETHTEKMSTEDYLKANGTKTSIEYLGNNTSVYDGNELLAGEKDGVYYTFMKGSSHQGQSSFDFDKVKDHMKLAVSLDADTQGTRILIDGVVRNGQVYFEPTDPKIQELLANDQFHLASVVYDPGETLADGSRRLYSFATDGGNGLQESVFEKTVTERIPHTETLYDVVGFEKNAEKILHGSDLIDGGIPLPFATRKNLTPGKKGERHGPSGPVNTEGLPTPERAPSNNGDNTPTQSPSSSDGGGAGPATATAPSNNVETPTSTVSETFTVPESDSHTTTIEDDEDGDGSLTPVERLMRDGFDMPDGSHVDFDLIDERARTYKPIDDINDTRDIMVSDDRIAALNPNNGPSGDELRRIRGILTDWNLSSPQDRQKMMAGNFDEWGDQKDEMKADFNLLRKFNIIKVPEPEEEPEAQEAAPVIETNEGGSPEAQEAA